jgi:hypothetical protein
MTFPRELQLRFNPLPSTVPAHAFSEITQHRRLNNDRAVDRIVGLSADGWSSANQKKAEEYFAKVNGKVANLISEVIRKWDLAGL